MTVYHKLINGKVLNNYELGDISQEEAFAQGYKTLTVDPQEEGKFYAVSHFTETEHNIHKHLVEIEDPSIPEKEAEREIMRQLRSEAYKEEKDPVTCHIESLKDEDQTPEIVSEIQDLKEERADIVEKIKEKYPYPDEK